jgi:hypothetical protein
LTIESGKKKRLERKVWAGFKFSQKLVDEVANWQGG